MKPCETCGNVYDRPMEVRLHGETEPHVFDCFECAVQTLAPKCEHCGTRIVGHGIQAGERMFCCAHCAHESGVSAARDRVA